MDTYKVIKKAVEQVVSATKTKLDGKRDKAAVGVFEGFGLGCHRFIFNYDENTKINDIYRNVSADTYIPIMHAKCSSGSYGKLYERFELFTVDDANGNYGRYAVSCQGGFNSSKPHFMHIEDLYDYGNSDNTALAEDSVLVYATGAGHVWDYVVYKRLGDSKATSKGCGVPQSFIFHDLVKDEYEGQRDKIYYHAETIELDDTSVTKGTGEFSDMLTLDELKARAVIATNGMLYVANMDGGELIDIPTVASEEVEEQ